MGVCSIRSEGGTWGMRRVTLELPRFESAIIATKGSTKEGIIAIVLRRPELLLLLYASKKGHECDPS